MLKMILSKYIKKHKFSGTLIYCPFCKSPLVIYSDVHETKSCMGKDIKVIWRATCSRCKAKGIVNEMWHKN